MRLSAYIAKKYDLSRAFAKTLIRQGKVRQGSAPHLIPVGRADIEVVDGVEYTTDITPVTPVYDLQQHLIRNDGDVVFLYKPYDMHTERHTPLDPLCLSDIAADAFPGFRLISRLDYGVSGVVAVVRNGINVENQSKTYLAWVEGSFPEKLVQRWAVDADKRKRVRAYQSPDGELMMLRCLQSADGLSVGGLSLIEIVLEKAHRHQVRAVCAALGYPIVGDEVYGKSVGAGLARPRIYLHCAQVEVNGYTCESFYNQQFRYRSWPTPFFEIDLL